MTDTERLREIEILEARREEIIKELESCVGEASLLMRRPALGRRKYKLGKSPNDRLPKK